VPGGSWGRPFTHYFIVIKRRDEGVHVIRHKIGDDPLDIKWRGNSYVVRPRKAKRMQGWDPIRRKDFFSTIFDRLPYHRVGLFIFQEPDGISPVPIESLDRISNKPLLACQSPFIIRVFARSKLFQRWIKRTNFGSGVNLKFVAIMLLVILVVVLVLWFGGFYG
jgi:hypothetical protein